MKRYILFCLLSFNSVSLFAGEIAWYAGSVVLKTKEVLVGEFAMEPEYDLVLHRRNGKVEVYPAHRVHSLYFYDKNENINRKFISLKEANLFNHHQLLEIVLRGEVSIYRKQNPWTENPPSDADGFYYFIHYREQLIDLKKFHNSVYPHLLESAGSLLTVFIDENKLEPNSSADAILIVEFYNQLKIEDQLLAKH